MTPRRRFLTILLLGFLTAIVPFSIDMYLPGFPDIALSMQTSVSKVALSLSSFFIGIAVGQLAYGPILDRFGRKRPLYAGLIFYCLTSIACSFAKSIELLIALRFIQALGACSASVGATAMVRDIFPPKENAKIFSFLMLVLSASPMLAPTIGGYITGAFGWQAIFILLAIMIALILTLVFFFLPESKQPDKSYSLSFSSIICNYKEVLKEKQFLVYSFVGAIGFSGMFSYIASSPGIFMGNYHLTQQQYGFLFASMASGFIVGSQVNNLLLKRFTSEQIIRPALIFQNVLGIALVTVSLLHLDNFWLLVSLLFCYIAPIGFLLPNTAALSMRPFSKNTGSAAALLGVIQMGMGAMSSVMIGLFDVKTVLPMTIVLVCTSLLALLILLVGSRSLPVMVESGEAGVPVQLH